MKVGSNNFRLMVVKTFGFQLLLFFIPYTFIVSLVEYASGTFEWGSVLLNGFLYSVAMALFFMGWGYYELKKVKPLRFTEEQLLIIWQEDIPFHASFEQLKKEVLSNWRFKKYKVYEDLDTQLKIQRRQGVGTHSISLKLNEEKYIEVEIAVNGLWHFDRNIMGKQMATSIKKISNQVS